MPARDQQCHTAFVGFPSRGDNRRRVHRREGLLCQRQAKRSRLQNRWHRIGSARQSWSRSWYPQDGTEGGLAGAAVDDEPIILLPELVAISGIVQDVGEVVEDRHVALDHVGLIRVAASAVVSCQRRNGE